MSEYTSKKALLKDVAAAANVSPATASLILNGKVDAFPESTIARVRESAARLQYRPNALARSFRSQKTHTIGLISDEIATKPFSGAMIRGAQEAAWKAGHVLILIDTEGDAEMEHAALMAVFDRRVDGLLYARMHHQIVMVPSMVAEMPVVLLDARDPDSSLPSVVPDEMGGAAAAVQHLLEMGHERIGYVQNTDPVPAAEERFTAYQATLESAGLTFDESLVVFDSLEPGGRSPGVEQLLARADRPTALFCFNDLTALRAYQSARRLGLAIPGDLSVVGFDNLETIAPWLDPGLTTIQLPHYEMGRWAVEHLERMIKGEHLPAVQHRLPCPLVIRESVTEPGIYEPATTE